LANFVSSGALAELALPPRAQPAKSDFLHPECDSSHQQLAAEMRRCLGLVETAVQANRSSQHASSPGLKPGTRLVREWQGRTYEVLVLDGGFSWQDTHHRSLSALAGKITGTAWSGPLFFGLKPNRPANRRSSQSAYPTGDAMESSNAAG
jgi:hypothetical protein